MAIKLKPPWRPPDRGARSRRRRRPPAASCSPTPPRKSPRRSKVLAVGDGKISEETGSGTPLDVKAGDEVLYSKYGGTEIKVDGQELLVLRESDVLAKVL